MSVQTILDLNFPEELNKIFSNGNTNLVIGKKIGEEVFMDCLSLACQESEEEGVPDVAVAVIQTYTVTPDECNETKNIISSEIILGNTNPETENYNPVFISITSSGVMKIKAKVYSTIQDAQNDTNLQVNEIYKCDGAIRYKE